MPATDIAAVWATVTVVNPAASGNLRLDPTGGAAAVTLDYTTHVEPMVRDMASLLATAALVRKIGAPDDLPGDAAAQP